MLLNQAPVLNLIKTEPPSNFDQIIQFFCNADLFLFKLHREEYSEEVQKYLGHELHIPQTQKGEADMLPSVPRE